MKKLFLILGMLSICFVLAACSSKCEQEPILEENTKLITPPNFGKIPS